MMGFRKACRSIWDNYGFEQEIGVCFDMLIRERSERLEYRVIAREVTGAIRSYIRAVLLDSKAFQKGFEET